MRKKIGELLVEAGVVTEAQVRTALAQKKSYGKGHRLGSVMVSMGLVTPAQLARALATQFDMPFVELPEIPPQVTSLLSLDFQSEQRIVPFRLEADGKSERLHVAVEDPGDLTLVDELRFQLRKTLRVYVAASDDIDNALLQARGEKLDIVQAIPLDEEDGRGLPIQRAAAPPVLLPTAPPPPPKEASTDFIDDLLGAKPRAAADTPPPPPPPDPTVPRVPVVIFGGAAKNVKPPEPNRPPNFSEEDLQVLDNLERLSKGEEPTALVQKVMPAQMVAALIRLLITKGVIQEEEFLDELARK